MRILTLSLVLVFLSCTMFDNSTKQTVLARVGDKYLNHDDIVGIVPKNSSERDSIFIVNNYIKNWVKDNLMLHKAELNLKDSQKDVQKQLEDYRRSLIVYAYEKELIKQRLNTDVLDKEIQTFYKNSNQKFELKDDIVKVRYLKVNKKAPQVKTIRSIYKSNKEEDIEKLKELAHQYAEKFYLTDEKWILFNELKKELPIHVSQTKEYLKNTKNIEVEDSLFYYFVSIKDYRLKNTDSPLSFEAYNIKNIIINKRKLSLINKIRSDLYQEAFINKDIEIYGKKNDEE